MTEVCEPKKQGGLGIINLDVFNKAQLAKWIWKLETKEDFWQTLLLNEYPKGACFFFSSKYKQGVSQFWSGIMSMKSIFYIYVKRKCWQWGQHQVLGRLVD